MYEEWLQARAPGYKSLAPAERDAIAGFLHFWALFEGRLLNERAGPDKICRLAARWNSDDLADSAPVCAALNYWRNRYFAGGEPNGRFESLLFRPNDHEELVVDVMAGAPDDAESVMAAVLLIIYRLRNNLFHGLKWQYGLADQEGNFRHANRVLMEVLDRYGDL
ncbi:MAG: hypothetical protein Q8L59_04995 [Phenylobacterium sp.]|uniref:hypothetical protein n=1 Tax=Phenylobacterium sp. TaxID=1871053 RepID=UPI00273466F2|nr:hypothetical protein [Phenylobacterium sp.]MDP1641519.1 hypothetical protein [Phenylobacterium sp.]MDP3117660.1 hypothetical protein [Phenylobacterium sp.]